MPDHNMAGYAGAKLFAQRKTKEVASSGLIATPPSGEVGGRLFKSGRYEYACPVFANDNPKWASFHWKIPRGDHDVPHQNMSNAEKIKLAQSLLSEVSDTLATEKTTCPCCGLTKYSDRSAYQTKEQLDAMVSKLNRFASSGVVAGNSQDD